MRRLSRRPQKKGRKSKTRKASNRNIAAKRRSRKLRKQGLKSARVKAVAQSGLVTPVRKKYRHLPRVIEYTVLVLHVIILLHSIYEQYGKHV